MHFCHTCCNSSTHAAGGSNKEEREEGGTPDIMGSIRLGLVVQMKERLGGQAILVSVAAALSRVMLYFLWRHPHATPIAPPLPRC